jgi:hypothetical protein
VKRKCIDLFNLNMSAVTERSAIQKEMLNTFCFYDNQLKCIYSSLETCQNSDILFHQGALCLLRQRAICLELILQKCCRLFDMGERILPTVNLCTYALWLDLPSWIKLPQSDEESQPDEESRSALSSITGLPVQPDQERDRSVDSSDTILDTFVDTSDDESDDSDAEQE